MLNGLKNAFRIKELREKILFTIAMLVVYRIGAHVPVPGIPFQGMLGLFSTDNNSVAAGAMALLNLFSGGALSYVSVFSLGIMPSITSIDDPAAGAGRRALAVRAAGPARGHGPVRPRSRR